MYVEGVFNVVFCILHVDYAFFMHLSCGINSFMIDYASFMHDCASFTRDYASFIHDYASSMHYYAFIFDYASFICLKYQFNLWVLHSLVNDGFALESAESC